MSAAAPTDSGTCRHCKNPIVFGMYWVGTVKAAPRPIWYHPPGNQTCLVKPDGWKGKKGEGAWPMAEPEPEDS
jgi:hypothetical protein